MRQFSFAVLILGSIVAWPSPAAAQRQPHAESTAVGVDVGAFVPSADGYDPGLLVDGFWQYYFTPRVSVRAMLGLADPGRDVEPEDSYRRIPFQIGINYNWEHVQWHPFVGAGIGAYFLQLKDNGHSIGDSRKEAGFDFGGGIEYFFRADVTFKGELRYEAVGTPPGYPDPSGLMISGGLKKYF
jgi:hypothetical protein